jgi:phenylpyruvate tautomerase PptA (4-oxalocrotonate tautomerase family)
MALVRINILEGQPPNHRRALLDALHDALVGALQVPHGDPTLCVIEHDRLNVRLPTVPHVVSDNWTLVEITMFAGRSVETKRKLYQEIVRRLVALGTPAADITVVLIESATENWGVHGGQAASEIDLGFTVNI